MAVLVVAGKVTKEGTGEYGDWFVVSETRPKKDGSGTFETRYMCSGKARPAIDEFVIVQGFGWAKVTESNGNHYANMQINAAQFTVLDGFAGATEAAPRGSDSLAQEFADEEIPF